MIKKTLVFICMCAALAAESIQGFWKTVDDKTGKAQSVVAIYPYKGVYYGRMIGTFDDKGKMKDDIYNPIERAPGVFGNPFYAGLDFIWDLRPRDDKYSGRIMDPENGDVYHCSLWVEKGKLVVEGRLMMFSRSQMWLPASKKDFPSGFKMPDIKDFVPELPQGVK